MPDSDDDEELGSGRRTGGGGVVPPALLALIPPKYLGAHLVGDSDAEIARWRQERRRNFPTEGRVAQKRQRDEERSERGQLPGFTGPAGRMGGGVRAQQQRGGARGGAAPRAMPGHCRNGSHCRYSHLTGAAAAAAAAAAPASGSIPAACRWYLMGVCAAGARCPYQHALAGAAAGTGAGEAQGLLRKLLARDVQRETSVLLQAVRHLVRTALHPVVDSGGDGRQTAADAGAASGDSGGCAAAALAPSG